jgi:hypothetical protein
MRRHEGLLSSVSRDRDRSNCSRLRSASASRRGCGEQRQRAPLTRAGDGRAASQTHTPTPCLYVRVVSADAGFRCPAIAVGAELQTQAASPTAWWTAVRHHPGAIQYQPRTVHLRRWAMRPQRRFIRGFSGGARHERRFTRFMVLSPWRENEGGP